MGEPICFRLPLDKDAKFREFLKAIGLGATEIMPSLLETAYKVLDDHFAGTKFVKEDIIAWDDAKKLTPELDMQETINRYTFLFASELVQAVWDTITEGEKYEDIPISSPGLFSQVYRYR